MCVYIKALGRSPGRQFCADERADLWLLIRLATISEVTDNFHRSNIEDNDVLWEENSSSHATLSTSVKALKVENLHGVFLTISIR